MTDQEPNKDIDTAANPEGAFTIRKIYVKDVSFETPNSPEIFSIKWTPDADVNLRTEVKQLAPGEYEVTLTITSTMTVGDKTAFLVEVQQAGIFAITGMTSEELGPILGAYCPGMLYPYAREMVSDLVIRGGFPPFVLAPVNFDALYESNRAEQEAAHTGPGNGAATDTEHAD